MLQFFAPVKTFFAANTHLNKNWHSFCYKFIWHVSFFTEMEWGSLIFQKAGNAKPKTTILNGEYKNMQTNSDTTKVSDVASKVIDKIMMATGIIAYVWILAFLLVGMIAK